MLHDVGGLLTHILVTEEAQEIDRVVAKGADRIEMETDRLGFTYPEAGAELASRWKFPNEIVDAIRHQLEPKVSEDEYKSLAGVLLVATYLYENKDTDTETLINNFPSDHATLSGIDKVSLIDNIEAIQEMDNGLDDLFD